MKRVLAIVFLAVIILGAWYLFFKTDKGTTESEPKVEALTVKKHSDDFNQKVANTVQSYLDVKNALVEADTAAVKASANKFLISIDSLPLAELQKDDSLIS